MLLFFNPKKVKIFLWEDIDMELKQLQEELTEMIKIRMTGHKTVLGIKDFQDRSISELRFYARLLDKIDTPDSRNTAAYIRKIVNKALDGTFQIGD